MSEARTVREARLKIREAERAIDAIRMSPAVALGGMASWYLRAAQAKLRRAEREFAKHDDPRQEPLKPLAPNVARVTSTRERRRRYRCASCLVEQLKRPSFIEQGPLHYRVQRGEDGGYVRVDCGEWQPVARLPKGKAS